MASSASDTWLTASGSPDVVDAFLKQVSEEPIAGAQFQAGGSPPGQFSSAVFFSNLTAPTFGRLLLTCGSIGSTQEFLYSNKRRFPSGAVCVADQQSSGKGRGGNTWVSPPGSLLFTSLADLALEGQKLPLVQHIACLALVDAVEELAQEALEKEQIAQGPALGLRIKWPNDIYHGSQKIGGVLCQSSYMAPGFRMLVGIGLNVDNQEPTTAVNQILKERGVAVQREAVAAAFLSRFEEYIQELKVQGFGQLKERYERRWMHGNQNMQLRMEESEEIVEVVVSKLSQGGYLMAVDSSGQVYELHPDYTSILLMDNLILKKVY